MLNLNLAIIRHYARSNFADTYYRVFKINYFLRNGAEVRDRLTVVVFDTTMTIIRTWTVESDGTFVRPNEKGMGACSEDINTTPVSHGISVMIVENFNN
jgi:hypothetical protein